MWPKLGKKYALNLSDAGLGICSISIFHSIWTTNNKKCSVVLAQSRWVTIPKSDRCDGDSSLYRGPLGCQNVPKSTYKHLPTSAAPELWGHVAFFILYFDSISNRVMWIFDFDFGIIIPNPLNFSKSTWISISIVIRELLAQNTQNNKCTR